MFVFIFSKKQAGAEDSGGGGGFSADSVMPGLHTQAALGAGGQVSYTAVGPSGNYMGAYTPKVNVSGPPTYVAPKVIQNQITPGSALPAPSPGTGLGPRAIIL